MLVRSAWLYTRGADSVRIEVRDEGTRFLVVVKGPGERGSHRVLTDFAAALQHQQTLQAELLAHAFVLEGYEEWNPPRRNRRPVAARSVDAPESVSPNAVAGEAPGDVGDPQ